MCGYVAVKEKVVPPVIGVGGVPETRIFHALDKQIYPITVFINPDGEICGVCDDEAGITPIGDTESERIASVIRQFTEALNRDHIHESDGEATFCAVNQPGGENAGKWS